MRLTILGCSGTFPGPAAAASSYLVEAGGFRLLLDLGSGASGALQRHVDPAEVDAVVVSHLHGDHYLDLIPFGYARIFHPKGPLPRLAVFGPPATHQRLSDVQGSNDRIDKAYDVRVVAAGRQEIGPFVVDFARTAHPVETYGARLAADGATLAYSADSGPAEALVRLAKGTDAFLCEASLPDDHPVPDLHLTGRQAGEHAARAGAGRLLLTHIVPYRDSDVTRADAATAYDGPIDVARADQTCDI